MIFNSNAKINLGLKIINQRPDGFHNLESIFIELDIGDEILFTPSDVFSLTTNLEKLACDESNTIVQAYNLMKSKLSEPRTDFNIKVKKVIPMGSGLGGGSSNAATTIKALNQLWEMNIDAYQLEQYCNIISSDAPFFIKGKTQFVKGTGNKLQSIEYNQFKDLYFLLIMSDVHIDTKWAYQNISFKNNQNSNILASLEKSLNWSLFENDFEKVVFETYPEIGIIKQDLKKLGAIYSSLSGSGSTVFGIFNNIGVAKQAKEKFSNYQTFLTLPT